MVVPKRITQQQLIAKAKDLELDDEEIAQYLVLDKNTGNAFSPRFIANPNLVEESGLEAAFALNAVNRLARSRRNRRYRRRIKHWNGVRVVAEGDSWFQYPFLLRDTIDQLADLKHFQYAIYGLSEASDLLDNIIREDEISAAIERENPDVFLISAGGNDMIGNGRAANLVHKYATRRKAENYPNEHYDQFLLELDKLYRGLFTHLLTLRPHLKIVCHGYDNVIPQDGPWLGKPLLSRGIKNKVLQRRIIAEMIRRFNTVMKKLAADFRGSVYYVDCQKLIGGVAMWHDELHPKNAGFFKVARKFDKMIKLALHEAAACPAIELSATAQTNSNGCNTPIKLAKLRKLDSREFLNLLIKRAELTMNRPVKVPKSRFERRRIENEISDFFEKVHKTANFLPISFLENGVHRAQAVCRIETASGFGSGFLIGARNFIMTNNHVLPNRETAATAKALFDYDEDTIQYSVSLNPDRLFITDQGLDFSIVACDPSTLPAEIAAIPLLRDPDTITRGERVNIIQHPRGGTKHLSLHDNKVRYVYDIGIRYTADTEGGSSGSPVFNNQWNLVALHHAGWVDASGNACNEGIRIKAIVEYLIKQNEAGSSVLLARLCNTVSACQDQTDGLTNTVIDPNTVVDRQDQAEKPSSITLKLARGISAITIKLS